MKEEGSHTKFIYNQTTIDDLKQLGFSIEILRVNGGEMPLPELSIHVDEQASLEAYWNAQAEKARYKLKLAEDKYKYWYETKYNQCFSELVDMGVPKPIQKEVESRIAEQYSKVLRQKQEKLRKVEYRYRMLMNCCVASIVTKGRMMQSLRNIVQGNTYKMGTLDPEVMSENNSLSIPVTT